MDPGLLKILFNTSLFILIWIVQLIIYPGFLHYREDDLTTWHRIYTTRITVIVLPLMVGQLLLYSYSAFFATTYLSIVVLIIIICIWIVTFLMAVPLHNSIGVRESTIEERKQLVKVNWIRTVLWTLVLLISFAEYGNWTVRF